MDIDSQRYLAKIWSDVTLGCDLVTKRIAEFDILPNSVTFP